MGEARFIWYFMAYLMFLLPRLRFTELERNLLYSGYSLAIVSFVERYMYFTQEPNRLNRNLNELKESRNLDH